MFLNKFMINIIHKTLYILIAMSLICGIIFPQVALANNNNEILFFSEEIQPYKSTHVNPYIHLDYIYNENGGITPTITISATLLNMEQYPKVRFQWQTSTDGRLWTDITGADYIILTLRCVPEVLGRYYRLIVFAS